MKNIYKTTINFKGKFKFLSLAISLILLTFGCTKSNEDVEPKKLEATSNFADLIDDTYTWITNGQYVSKDTKVVSNGEERPTRPKFDNVGSTRNGRTLATVFMSSENQGLIGTYATPIYDLKIAKSSSSSVAPLDGYVKIPLDLNKGAGGAYIYLTFTRDRSKVQGTNNSTDYIYDYTAVAYDNGLNYSKLPADGWESIKMPWDNIFDPWKVPDLNDGAAGKYIFGYLTKGSNSILLNKYYDSRDSSPIMEVGVIAGGSSSIAPPLGWKKVPQDLNQGAGGDYIYFCFRKY
jgi:hypothetical protein